MVLGPLTAFSPLAISLVVTPLLEYHFCGIYNYLSRLLHLFLSIAVPERLGAKNKDSNFFRVSWGLDHWGKLAEPGIAACRPQDRYLSPGTCVPGTEVCCCLCPRSVSGSPPPQPTHGPAEPSRRWPLSMPGLFSSQPWLLLHLCCDQVHASS